MTDVSIVSKNKAIKKLTTDICTDRMRDSFTVGLCIVELSSFCVCYDTEFSLFCVFHC